MMSGIRGKDTKPEIRLRKALHAQGFRFRLKGQGLPGRPDIVLPKWHLAIFVHGCFWHRHPGCSKATMPKSNVEFWAEKFAANVQRDERAVEQLEDMGWRTAVVWECAIGRRISNSLVDDLAAFIRDTERQQAVFDTAPSPE